MKKYTKEGHLLVEGIGPGLGDMSTAIYDTDNNGIVDDSDALGGLPAADYALVTYVDAQDAAIDAALTAHIGDTGNPHAVTKAQVGLGNADNTSDLNKPVSTATQTALNLKADLASPTFTGVPAAPTAAPGTNTTQVATTAFVTTAIAGSGYTDEQAQDAVGNILTDSSTIDMTYNDGANTISAAAITQMSITADASGLKLSGDATSPGNSKYYGTNDSGTKGFYDVIRTISSTLTLSFGASTGATTATATILNANVPATFKGISFMPQSNSNHTSIEAALEQIQLTYDYTAGVSIEVTAYAPNGTWGDYLYGYSFNY